MFLRILLSAIPLFAFHWCPPPPLSLHVPTAHTTVSHIPPTCTNSYAKDEWNADNNNIPHPVLIIALLRQFRSQILELRVLNLVRRTKYIRTFFFIRW